MVIPLLQADVEQLRATHYNAQIIDIVPSSDDLMVLRVRPDRGIPHFLAGQYTVLGLGDWEPRVEGVVGLRRGTPLLARPRKGAYRRLWFLCLL